MVNSLVGNQAGLLAAVPRVATEGTTAAAMCNDQTVTCVRGDTLMCYCLSY